MSGLQLNDLGKKQILSHLEDFEAFFLGKKYLSPLEVQNLNEELSIGAVLHVGTYRLRKIDTAVHLIWLPPNKDEHDLGPVENLNIVRDCPGFHRSRSLALGQEHVETSGHIHVPDIQANISIVKMKDGSTGYGPNYKLALRNAALKMHLKSAFERANPPGFWKTLLGNA